MTRVDRIAWFHRNRQPMARGLMSVADDGGLDS